MKHLMELPVRRSSSCPVHSRRAQVQKAEVSLYVCVCPWDTCTRAQLAAVK